MDMKAMMAEQMEEMLRDKYIQSMKAGYDLGERRMVEWSKEWGEEFRREYYRRNLMDLGDGTKPVYFGIFLDEASRNALLGVLRGGIPDDWKIYTHHVTLAFGDPRRAYPEVEDYIVNNLGKTASIEVVSVGVSGDAIAVGVTGNFKTTNSVPHITIATPPDGKPVKSNFITQWTPFHFHTALRGVVDSYPSHFKWPH